MTTSEVKADSYLIVYEVRTPFGTVVQRGEAFGAKSWIDQKQYGVANTIKRVKSALGMKWATKTHKREGATASEICRGFDDGNSLHIWVMREGGSAATPSADKPAYSQALEDELFNNAVIKLMSGADFGAVADDLHKAINAYALDEAMSESTVRDVLTERYDDANDMFR